MPIYFNPLGRKIEVEEDGRLFTADKDELDYKVVDGDSVQFTVGSGRAFLYSDILINEVEPADYSEFRQLFASLFPNTDSSSGGTGMTSLFLEIVDTYADISLESNATRLIKVNADETNNNDTSLYLHDGDEILFLLTIE